MSLVLLYSMVIMIENIISFLLLAFQTSIISSQYKSQLYKLWSFRGIIGCAGETWKIEWRSSFTEELCWWIKSKEFDILYRLDHLWRENWANQNIWIRVLNVKQNKDTKKLWLVIFAALRKKITFQFSQWKSRCGK